LYSAENHTSHCAVISQIPNKRFLSYRLNCPKLEICRRLIGKLFHKRGPATAKQRSFRSKTIVWTYTNIEGRLLLPDHEEVGKIWDQLKMRDM